MSNVTARKGRRLDDIIGDLVVPQPEDMRTSKVENGLIGHVLGVYVAYVQNEDCYSSTGHLKLGVEEELYDRLKPLTATQCSELLNHLKAFSGMEYSSALWSSFVDMLIQRSYDEGHNDFVVDSSQCPTPDYDVLFTDLKGKAAKPLHITLRTKNPNLKLGTAAEYGFGTVPKFEPGIEHCIFEVYGNLLKNNEALPYADGATNCMYIQYGLLQAREDKYFGMADFKDPENCTFKTTNRRTLKILRQTLPTSKGNKIYFIDRNGKEELVRD